LNKNVRLAAKRGMREAERTQRRAPVAAFHWIGARGRLNPQFDSVHCGSPNRNGKALTSQA